MIEEHNSKRLFCNRKPFSQPIKAATGFIAIFIKTLFQTNLLPSSSQNGLSPDLDNKSITSSASLKPGPSPNLPNDIFPSPAQFTTPGSGLQAPCDIDAANTR